MVASSPSEWESPLATLGALWVTLALMDVADPNAIALA
jgi:hypothetical protein